MSKPALYSISGIVGILAVVTLIIGGASKLQHNIRVTILMHRLDEIILLSRPISDLCEQGPLRMTQQDSSNENVAEMARFGCIPLLQSRVACASGNQEDAQAWYEKARESCPRPALLAEWNGQLVWANGEREQAMNIWLTLPSASRYLETRAYTYWNNKDKATSQFILETLLPAYVNELADHQIHRAYAILDQSYREKGDVHNVVRIRKELVGVEPERSQNWIRLGAALSQNGETDRSLEVLDHALMLVHDDGDPFLIGWAYSTLGHTQAAMEEYSKAVESLNTALDWYNTSRSKNDSQIQYVKRKISQWESLQ